MALTYLAALVLIAASLSILTAGAFLVQQRTGNSGWVDAIGIFSLGLVGVPVRYGRSEARRMRGGTRYRDYQLRTSRFFPLPPQA